MLNGETQSTETAVSRHTNESPPRAAGDCRANAKWSGLPAAGNPNDGLPGYPRRAGYFLECGIIKTALIQYRLFLPKPNKRSKAERNAAIVNEKPVSTTLWAFKCAKFCFIWFMYSFLISPWIHCKKKILFNDYLIIFGIIIIIMYFISGKSCDAVKNPDFIPSPFPL